MARLDLRHPDNAPGEWYVDDRCIDCGTCRDLAPHLFGDTCDQSIVIHQPGDTPEAELGAWLAAQACPTQSIGTATHRPRPGRLFPHEIAPGTGVYDCGYCSADSFGATSWFVRRAGGNVMVDCTPVHECTGRPRSPTWAGSTTSCSPTATTSPTRTAGPRTSAPRVWIHDDDRSAAPFATDVLHGPRRGRDRRTTCWPIPTPGHTRGSTVFLLEDTYLFTGDSLAWSHDRDDLTAFRTACWYSWSVQTESLARLADRHRFAWVLPGHGARVGSDHDDLHRRLVALVGRMHGSGRLSPPPSAAADLLIAGAALVATCDDDRRELAGGWVAITDGLVSGVGPAGLRAGRRPHDPGRRLPGHARAWSTPTTTSTRTSPGPTARPRRPTCSAG